MRLIDADMLKKDLSISGSCNNCAYKGIFGCLEDIMIADVCYSIHEAPTVEAVPVRHGQWEMKHDPYGFFDEIPVCSECGHTTEMRKTYKFCPNCGAKMDGERRGEDDH